MELFERAACYGLNSVLAIYLSNSIQDGGLGFSEQSVGFLQSLIYACTYVIPILGGALADRYGYRRILINYFGEISILGVITDITERRLAEREREKLVQNLQDSIAKIETLDGLLPICSSCKKIRDDDGYWQQFEQDIGECSEDQFTYGICPECTKILFPRISTAMRTSE